MKTPYQSKFVPRTVVLGVLILCMSSLLSAQNLYVQPIGGEQVSFELAKKPKITMSSRTMTIEMPTANGVYPLKEIQNLSFVKKNDTPTNIALDLGDKVRLYPNPVKDELELIVQLPTNGLRFQIYDLSGVAVQADEVRTATTKINVEKFPTGVYILRLNQNGQEIQSFKIVKQ